MKTSEPLHLSIIFPTNSRIMLSFEYFTRLSIFYRLAQKQINFVIFAPQHPLTQIWIWLNFEPRLFPVMYTWTFRSPSLLAKFQLFWSIMNRTDNFSVQKKKTVVHKTGYFLACLHQKWFLWYFRTVKWIFCPSPLHPVYMVDLQQ